MATPFKVLFASDLHDHPECLVYLRRYIEGQSPRLVVLAGDITNGSGLGLAPKYVGLAESMGCRVLAVGGNLDDGHVNDYLKETGISIDCVKRTVDGIKFAGLGGGLAFRRNTPTEYSEDEFAAKLDGLLGPGVVFVTHTPPRGTVADLSNGGIHVGSKAIRHAIEECRPKLAVCGHIHEAAGTQMLGATKLVKLQPMMAGRAVVVDAVTLAHEFLPATP